MIRTEIRTIITCDFCGNEFMADTASYPHGEKGEYAVYNLSLSCEITNPETGITRIIGADSPYFGFCKGHICPNCLKEITDKIHHCKASKEGEKRGSITASPYLQE